MTISQLASPAKWGGALRSIASTRLEIPENPAGYFFRGPGQCLRNFMLIGVGIFLCLQAGATSSAILSWDANPEPDIAGYTVSYGTAPGAYDHSVEAGSVTETEVSGLEEGNTYYFAVAAFNQAGYRSPNSDEVAYFVEPEAPANQAPVAISTSKSTSEGQALVIALTGSDADNDLLTFHVIDSPSHGTLSGTPPTLTYTPTADFSGSDSFTFKANDGKVNSNVATVNIVVTSINHAPVATTASLTTAEDKALALTLAGTDRDLNTLTFAIGSGPTHGKLTGQAPNLTYTPNANYHGSDQFSFAVSDGSLVSAPAVIAISVTAVNDAPVVADKSFETESTSALPMTLTGSDVDGNPLTFKIATQPVHGTLSGIPPHLTYTSTTSYMGDDSFNFIANDGTMDSTSATITIKVTGSLSEKENSAPVFASSGFNPEIKEGSPLSGLLRATDADGDSMVFSKVSGPAWLSVSASGALGGTPSAKDTGLFRVTVKVEDSAGNSATATWTITVTATNHAPIFTQKSYSCLSGAEKITYWRQSLASTASDPDAGDLLTFSRTAGPTWLSLSADGTLSGTPPAGSAGLNRFTIRVTDRLGAYAESSLDITIFANSLPLPWTLNRLGKGLISDPATYAAGVFTLCGSGALVDTEDAGAFGWQKVGKSGVITARIRRIKNTGKDTRVGLMIRQSLAPGARQSFVSVDGKGKLHWLSRDQINQAATDKTVPGKKSANTWLRLKRRGNTLYAYRSSDGKKWQKVATSTIKLPKNCYIGLSVSSGDDAVRNTSKFSNVRVKP